MRAAAAWQQGVDQSGQSGLIRWCFAGPLPEIFQFAAAGFGQSPGVGAQQGGQCEGVIPWGHEGSRAGDHGGGGPVLVDFEVIDHRIHGKWQAVIQRPFVGQEDFCEPL